MKPIAKLTVTMTIAMLLAVSAGSVPRLQTYITGSDYYHIYQREYATWVTHNSTFDLKVVGYWNPASGEGGGSLTFRGEPVYEYLDTWLMIATPEGQSGNIYINGIEILSFDVYGAAVPSAIQANPSLQYHSPAGDAGAFKFYELGRVDNDQVNALNYAHGTINTPGWGDEILVNVIVSGYDWVHFDAVGIDANGETYVNAYSRDASYYGAVPEPGTLSLLGLGLLGMVPILRRKKE